MRVWVPAMLVAAALADEPRPHPSTPTPPLALRMDNASTGWAVFGPAWGGGGGDGEPWIAPAEEAVAEDGNLAIWLDRPFATFDATFDFALPMGWSSPGFVFGAANATSFYVLDVPSEGQQARGESSWATVSRVEPGCGGWRRALSTQRLPGVTSGVGARHSVRLRLSAGKLTFWVDQRPSTPVDLETSGAGFIGLSTYSMLGGLSKAIYYKPSIREYTTAPTLRFDKSVPLERPWREVKQYGVSTGVGNMVQAANGDLLAINDGGFLVSRDKGQTFEVGGRAPMDGQGLLTVSPHDGVISMFSSFGGYDDETGWLGARAGSASSGMGFRSISTCAQPTTPTCFLPPWPDVLAVHFAPLA